MSHPVSQHNPPSLLHSPSPAMDTETLQRRRPSSDSHNNAVIGEKRLKRSEVLAKKKAVEELIRTANAKRDHLASFPADRHFQINGLSVCLKSGHGNKLSSSVKHYIQGLLKLNMEGPYGSEWPEEEKVKRREMVAPEARYIFVHEVSNSNVDDTSAICLEDSGPLVGFVQYRFILEEEIPVLYVYELQLEPRVQGKGLGRFLMQLIELMAQKNCMGAVMLTVQKANLLAMNFYTSKLRYIISTMSPSKVNPMMEKSYEILCKTFNDEARTILEVEHQLSTVRLIF
ncbi:GNAT domain [Sesbania bispinosa]|nr:GNAT domain [Sesbania bispinosa]